MKGMGRFQLVFALLVVADCLQAAGLESGVFTVFPHMQVRIIWQKNQYFIVLRSHCVCYLNTKAGTVPSIRLCTAELFYLLLSSLPPCCLHLAVSAFSSFFNLLSIDRAPVFVLLPSSSLRPLYQSVGCAFVLLFGIKSDSLWDWMCVAMACCIWKAIHSAGTLEFNLKQDWCWQTSHPSLAKCFLYCTHQLLMEKGHTPLCNSDVRKNNAAK